MQITIMKREMYLCITISILIYISVPVRPLAADYPAVTPTTPPPVPEGKPDDCRVTSSSCVGVYFPSRNVKEMLEGGVTGGTFQILQVQNLLFAVFCA